MSKTRNTITIFPETAMPDGDWWQALWSQPRKVLVDLGIEPEMRVIDLCCGDGFFTAPLAAMARQVVAIDLDPDMVLRAQARIAAARVTNCTFVVGDAYDIAKLASEPADFVLLANILHGVPQKERLVRAVFDALKAGGRVGVINWHDRSREETIILGQPRGPRTDIRMKPTDVATAFKPAGFGLMRVIELPPYHYGAIFEKPITNSQRGYEKD